MILLSLFLILELTQSYLKDQNQHMAFKTYLEELERVKGGTIPSSPAYEEALKLYLSYPPTEAKKGAVEILKKWRDSDDVGVGFIVALAYANVNQYEKFFDRFFASYTQAPEHYLAYKTKAVLHIKVFERETDPELKEQERTKILKTLDQAKNEGDFSLIRLKINFTPLEKKKQVIEESLNKILVGTMIPLKFDLIFFIEQAQLYHLDDLTEKIRHRAHIWYPKSF